MVHSILVACISMGAALVSPVEDLPLIDHDTVTYQVSSHNKTGFNGDGGYYLHTEWVGEEGLAGWKEPHKTARALLSKGAAHEGQGALKHSVYLTDDQSGWCSVYKELSEGLNFSDCDRLSFWVRPTYSNGGVDYGVRIDSGSEETVLEVRNLKAKEWNHVVLDLGDTPRAGVRALWFVFHSDWGTEEAVYGWGTERKVTFNVDDITFLRPEGEPFLVDDFEKGGARTVLFDAKGPGSVRNIWNLGDYDIEIEVDGNKIVSAQQDNFFTGRVEGFPTPLVFQGLTASGPWHCVSHWSLVPIGFQERCKITTANPSPFYDFIAERYRSKEQVVPWRVDQDVSPLMEWHETAGRDPKQWEDLKEKSGKVAVTPGETVELARIRRGGALAAIRIAPGTTSEDVLRKTRLRIYWDGEDEPSVDAPLGIFFGAGVAWQDIPSLLIGVEGDEGYCYFPMPFWKGARIVVSSLGEEPLDNLAYTIRWRTEKYPKGKAGYFRTWYNQGATQKGRDWLFLDAVGHGQYVGVSHTLIGGHYCEGDIRFHLDGSRSPSLYGTGTEEYYGAACWPNINFHTPFYGCVGDVAKKAEGLEGKTFYDFPASYYRIHLEAPIRFSSGIHCAIEHGGTNDTDSTYSSLAYYYSQDVVGLQQTDYATIGSQEAAPSHAFEGIEEAERFELEDYFEGDDDEILVQFDGLWIREPLSVTLAIDPENKGIRLRRVLDQSQGPQGADVLIDGEFAGVWYNPDVNRFKKLAESDFDPPAELTRGKSSVKVTFRPHEGGWTLCELRAFSVVNGEEKVTDQRLALTPFHP